MGNRVSKPQIKVPHFFFKMVTAKNQFNREQIVVYHEMLRMDEFSEWEQIYALSKQMNKDNLLLAESFDREKIDKSFTCCQCPADYQMNITFERFDVLYKTQINKRIAQKKFYTEQQLFYILYGFLEGGKQFQVRGQKMGDIRPSNIVITKSLKIKLITLASFPWEITALQNILDRFNNTTLFYLAPEEIQFLQSKSKITINSAKSQAFSIGLTILEAALLENSQELYGLKPRSINHSLLNQKQQRIKQKYPLLESYLSKILMVKPEERYSSGQAWAVLRIYSQKISEARQFKINKTLETDSLTSFRKTNK